jgi:hypothetical protein
MPRFDVAHIREQGIDIIIIPLNSSFRFKSESEQREIISELQLRASSAGLAGTVVPVWDNGGGRMAFIAPENWHPFFRSIDLQFVAANINRQLFW